MPRLSEDHPTACCFQSSASRSPLLAMRQSALLRIAFVFLLVLITHQVSVISIRAQSATATLNGTVMDQNGAVIPGVNIAVISIAQGFQRLTRTNEAGTFVVSLLPPGNFILKAERDGFTPTEVRVVLNVNDQVALKVQLKVGSLRGQTVEIVDSAPLIDESPTVSTVVDRQFVGNLPLNGRSFQSLITLSPGVVLTKATTGEQGQFSANGQRADANYFIIDGVSANVGVSPGNNAGQSTAGTLPGLATTGGTNGLVSIDALQEFKILTSTFAPEFGRTPGAQISIVTRSGTNDFRGTLFEYFRDDALDAKDWFANSRGLPKPAFRQNDFGAVIGGPLYFPRLGEGGPFFYKGKNRTFFFFSYEGLRLRLPQTGITTVPSVNARQNAQASIQPFLNAFPRPSGRDLGNNFSEFNATYSDPSTLDATSIRIDHTTNKRITFFARYNYSPSETVQRGVSSRSLNSVTRTTITTQTLTAGATQVITPTINNDLRANYSRNRGGSVFTLDSFGGAILPSDSVLFPPSASAQDSVFTLLLGGTNTNWSQGAFQVDLQRQVNLIDTFSVVTGSHQMKFGVDYRRLFPVFQRANYSQSATFNGVNGALTGRATRVVVQAFTGPRFPLFTNISLFAQDTWRVAPRLTLTYGLRWELNPSPSESRGQDPVGVTNFDNPATLALAPPGTPLFKTRYNNFAPRIGAAFQLSQATGRETVLRGGFGVFYDLGTAQVASAFGVSFPYFRSKTLAPVGGQPFPLDAASAAPPPFTLTSPLGTLFGVIDPNFRLPYTYQWNLTVEQSLGRTQVLSTSYVAAVGRRLTRQELITNPNTNFGSLFATRNSATSDYHALQAEFQHRLSNHFQCIASYTWAHSIDNVSSDSSFEAPISRIDPNQERGPSDFDVRHAFNAAVTYDIPAPFANGPGNTLLRNFSIDTIFTARSPTPVNVTTGANPIGGIGVSRPDLIAGVPLYIADPMVAGERRINSAAFKIPVGRQGTLGRNALRGFAPWQLDLAVRRQFKLREPVNLQVRAEFFNIFNHPNFGDPGAGASGTNALNNALFGQSTLMLGRSLGSGGSGGGFSPIFQIGGPRSVQFALKLNF